jgi:hypothetical protein
MTLNKQIELYANKRRSLWMKVIMNYKRKNEEICETLLTILKNRGSRV